MRLSRGFVAGLLKQYGVRPNKKAGQIFLVDSRALERLVDLAEVNSDDGVLEIGAGFGNLTERLAHRARFVVAVEKDKKLFEALCKFLEGVPNVLLLSCDAMDLDYSQLASEHALNKMVSNLPYGIATAVILKLLLEAASIETMYCAVQREVAERITSPPGGREYSAYTAKIGLLADVSQVYLLSRKQFFPEPEVNSSFIRIVRKEVIFDREELEDIFGFIDACFLHRRKKLVNSLSAARGVSRGQIADALREIDKSPDVRAEELSPAEFVALRRVLLQPERQRGGAQ